MEKSIHSALISISYVFKPTWHDSIVEITHWRKGSLLGVIRIHFDLIVETEAAHEREY